MADHMETLLSNTPLINPTFPDVNLGNERQVPLLPVEDFYEESEDLEYNTPPSSLTEDPPTESPPTGDLFDVTPSTPEIYALPPSVPFSPCPTPSSPILLRPQVTVEDVDGGSDVGRYAVALGQRSINSSRWLSSQKEPLVEIPVKRVKQYWALVAEMEEYNEKRAAMALDGTGGRTMSEKEEGIKLFERFFGGLRSLEGRDKFQGTPPWEQIISEKKRQSLLRRAKKEKLARLFPGKFPLSTKSSGLSPAEHFRSQTQIQISPPVPRSSVTERNVWRFEDVSWVKQRTARPRKLSYAGTLDKRVRTESGVARYGPFGIGGGVEGVGGVKRVIERGLDGEVRIQEAEAKRRRPKREIVI
jgi:hypothetical protein